MKFKTFQYESIKSTNDTAIDLIKEKNLYGFVHAAIQTKGRGTHGKEWISLKGNLFGSIFFPLKKEYPPFNEFLIINSVIISEVIRHFSFNENLSLKYPNDVFLNRKKICGILQEVISFEDREFLIIGMGINIVSSPDIRGEYKATNFFLETKKKPKIEKIIDLLISSYEKFFDNLNLYNYLDFKKRAESISLY